MPLTLPSSNPRRARLLALGAGIAIFFWLRVEDNTVFPAIAAGAGLTLLIALLWLLRTFGGKTITARYALPGVALFGAVCGLGVSAASAGLMLLKNGMHGHAFPDYPFGVIVETLQRAPLWALAGGLAGFGFALAWWALQSTTLEPPDSP